MAIKRFGDYEKTQAYGDYEALPKGGYVVKILGAELCSNSVGQYVKISCDIAEGEYAGFYAKEYKAQQSEDKKWHCNYLLNIPNDDGSEKDNWTKRRFKTFTEALEESNPGYHLTGMSRNSKAKLLAVFSTKENMRRMTEVLEELPIWQPSAKSIKSAPVITNFQKTKS